MVNLLGGRAAAAVIGLCMLALGSSEASAAQGLPIDVKAAVASLDSNIAAKPLGTVAAPVATIVQKAAVASTTAVANAYGAVTQAQPARSVTVRLPAGIATEAAWLYKGGWPLAALVDKYSVGAPLDEQTNCLATAVYFEARGETLEGQLAVARVVMNRAASGKYPPNWCSTSSSTRNSHSFSTASSRRSTPVAPPGPAPRALPASPWPMSSRASATTSCGTMRPTSLRRGASASAGSSRSARTSSTAPDRSNRI